jgi:uncharacterized protein (TIGR03083 family)
VSVNQCLEAIRWRSAAISDVVRPLSAGEWQGSTNCPPWRVSDLATHIVTSGQGFVRSIRRGLQGIVEPAQVEPPAFAGPPEVAQALGRLTDEFEWLYAGLSEAQLETICFHRRGNRSIRWYAAHRLAEVTFHGWDLDVSLGRPAGIQDGVALLLLPVLLESNAPRTYAAGLSAERGRGERYSLAVTGEPTARWLVTITPETLEVIPGDGAADLSITAGAATLALLVYGRAELRSSGARLEGDLGLAQRFERTFPRP